MYKLKLVIDNYERWANNLFYEYFYPVKPDEEFYRKFLYKNFPYKFSDAYDLFPYNERSIPSIRPTELDKKLQEESLNNASGPFRNGFTSYIRMRTQAPDENVIRERYYNELALARHKEGLDYGMAPNYTYNYDKYIRPGQNMRASTEYNLAGGILNLELDSGDSDEYLYEWMLSGTMKQGKLVFYDGDLDQAFKIEFWDCYCIGIGEHMSSEGNTSMKLNLRLSPAITRNRSVEHEKIWKITDITPSGLNFASQGLINMPTEEPIKEQKLLVKKLEGPFFEDGKLAEEMIEGNTYIFKATEYTDSPKDKVANTKWAEELNADGEIKKLNGEKPYLDKDVVCYKYKARKAETIRLYAYVENADKKVSVEVPVVSFPFCVDRFRMPGLNSDGGDIAEDLAYGNGKNVTRKVYSESDVESFKSNYIEGKEFGLTALSNRNNSFNKAIYTKEEIYSIDYDYEAMDWKIKVPLFPLEKFASGIRWVDSKLRDVPDGVSAGSLVKYFHDHYTDDELFAGFEDLVTFYMAKDELKDNIIAMIRKFKRNEGGLYESELLTKNIESHQSTNTYCEELQDYIAEKLKNGKGKISDLIEKEIDWGTADAYDTRRKKGKITTRINNGKAVLFLKPQFNSGADLFEGQRIALNDIWATDVEITDYKIEGEEYTIKYNVILWDHFGLDKPDLEKWFNLIGRARAIFASWFTLQHLRGYKPFVTKIQFSREFSGMLN